MQKLSPAAPQRHKSLTIFPLRSANGAGLEYTLLPDAIRAGTVKITEVGSGTVPELIAINTGETDVLILDGEQLIGAKQNRTVSRSIVLPAKTETRIPVSCMESGRWRMGNPTFGASAHYSPAKVRGANRKVEARRAAEGELAAPEILAQAQGEVWRHIANYALNLDVGSRTGALDEITGARAEDLSACVERFPCVPDQVGLLAFIGGLPIGLDAIGDRDIYGRMHRRFVRAYALDALAAHDAGDGASPEAAEALLAKVGAATRVEAPTVGRGIYRVLSGDVVGGELEDDGRPVHLSAFPVEEEQTGRGPNLAPEDGPLPPPSHRRTRLG